MMVLFKLLLVLLVSQDSRLDLVFKAMHFVRRETVD